MEITEVRIKLMDDPQDRLQAFCSITFDGGFVVRDLKIIMGTKGAFVAMPSRKLTDRCPRCHTKNHLRAQFCSQCGAKLDEERAVKDGNGRAKLYADIAHPIKCECRDMIQSIVLEAFEEEKVKSQEPAYICRYDDYGEENFATLGEEYADEPSPVINLPAASGNHRHRIDPGPNTPTQLPAHHNGAPGTKAASAKVAVEQDEDSFGAGLL